MQEIKYKKENVCIEYDDVLGIVFATSIKKKKTLFISECFDVVKQFMEERGLKSVKYVSNYDIDNAYVVLEKDKNLEEFEKRNCEEEFNKKREEYLRKFSHVSLDSVLSDDYSSGYPDIYPLKDPLIKILSIKDEKARSVAINARYEYPSYPKLNSENEKHFVSFHQYGSKFLAEDPNWLKNYVKISNFLDEVVENMISLNQEGGTVDVKLSRDQLIKSALPQIIETFIPTGTEQEMLEYTRRMISWLEKFSRYNLEISHIQQSLDSK